MIPRTDLKDLKDLVAAALSEDSAEPVAIQPPSFLKIPSTNDCSATVIFLHASFIINESHYSHDSYYRD
jgi:hypothetical protein